MFPTRPYSSSRRQPATSPDKFWCVLANTTVNSILNRNTDVIFCFGFVQVVDGGGENLRGQPVPYPLSVLDPIAVASMYKAKL